MSVYNSVRADRPRSWDAAVGGLLLATSITGLTSAETSVLSRAQAVPAGVVMVAAGEPQPSITNSGSTSRQTIIMSGSGTVAS